eukprot:TRINITY_DN4742_c0_g1_i1.p1 TRINITY_DN4742_c0_g1~~TRINITY_DN4742_c0_g1_i1.p1  ORF type:complete len:236 (+),score=16.76 TRINITY_DN4742_c0_g1_i1:54-761(+)
MTMMARIYVGPLVLVALLLAVMSEGHRVVDPSPVFVTSDYVIVDRKVTLFCMNTCGGECEKCCEYHKDSLNPTSYLDICKGRRGLERSICLELLSNLEFICTRASYKYQTNKPVQEWHLQAVFPTAKRALSSNSEGHAVGITGSCVRTLRDSKRAIADTNHYHFDYVRDANTTKAYFQEVFVCASSYGAVHYKPVLPLSEHHPHDIPKVPFWDYYDHKHGHHYDHDDYPHYGYHH